MPRTHKPEIIDIALAALISCGNAESASRHLKAVEGLNITGRTILRWKEQHADRHDEILRLWQEHRDERVVTKLDSNTLLALEAQERAIEQALEEGKRHELRDAARAAQNLGIAAGVNTDKSLLLQNRPTALIEHRRSPDELLAKLAKALGAQTVDTTALPAGD